jgi:energy-coupling factor transporter ATP-binding protein EcfA2
MPARSSAPLIYFTSLELESVRCFGEPQKLDLTDGKGNPAQWTLLLGDNGVGKTTLLQCLSWMRPVPVQRGSGYEGTAALKEGPLGPALPDEENEVLEALLRSDKALELKLNAELSLNKQLVSLHGIKKTNRRSKSKKVKTQIQLFYTNRRELRRFKTSGTRIQTLGKFVEPLIVTYGASRHMERQNLDLSNLEDPIAARLGGSTELYDAEEILLRLDHAAAQKGYRPRGIENRRLEKVKEVLAHVLPDVQRASHIKILGPKIEGISGPSGVRFKTFSGVVALSGLSLGYQTTLAWTMDLAWRLFRNYPSSKDPLAEPAIVLIDEIDLHLHPLWQRTIMDHLSEVFPRTQFVATAHSPLMVQSAPNANLAVVQKVGDQVVISNEPHVVKTWRVDQILNSELFGLHFSRDKDTEMLFRERERLIDKKRLTRPEKIKLNRIDKEIASLPTETPEDEAALGFIRKAASLLKKYSHR